MTNDTMPERYARSVLKTVVAQICQMIGWHSINSTPFEFLVDLTQEYLVRVSKVTQQYAQVLGRTEANLDDLGLAFRHMHVEVPELVRYVRNVDSVPCLVGVPKFPVRRENHLNFLKPGSREVVTRPVHIHEYLPAMYPESEDHSSPIDKDDSFTECRLDSVNGNVSTPGPRLEGDQDASDDMECGDASAAVSVTSLGSSVGAPTTAVVATAAAAAVTTGGTAASTGVDAGAAGMPVASNNQGSPVFKRPGGPLPLELSTLAKRSKMLEEGRPLREIHSVIMTTSGFLSPAREGKLPEARTPHAARADSPPPSSSYPMVPPEFKVEKKPDKKKTVKKGGDDRKLDKENKKKNRVKELFKPDNVVSDAKPRKMAASAKQVGKTKPSAQASTHREPSSKVPRTTPQSRIKPIPDKVISSEITERGTAVVPTAASALSDLSDKRDNVDKLPSEPDKQKLNIFKKISKSREDKVSMETTGMGELSKQKQQQPVLDSRENSPGLVVDDNSEKRLGKRIDDVSTAAVSAATPATVNAVTGSNFPEKPRHETKTPRTPEVEIDGRGPAEPSSSEALHHATSSPDVYMFDDMSPPGTPSTPKTPELNVTPHVDSKKRKKERNARKKEQRSKSPKANVATKKLRASLDAQESPIPFDRPKTPQAIDTEPHHRETNSPSTATAATVAAAATLPFPFFPPFPAAPGLIPHPLGHPMFPRYPLPLGRGVPHPAMPNLPIPPRFFSSSIRPDDSLTGKAKFSERDKTSAGAASVNASGGVGGGDEPLSAYGEVDKFQKDIVEKTTKSSKSDKEIGHHAITAGLAVTQSNVAASNSSLTSSNITVAAGATVVTAVNSSTVAVSAVSAFSRSTTKNLKVDKLDKNNKKSKDHKRERKDKIKKKKDKKDKHKIKEKSKGKKGKLGKLKDKKEKKDKRKDKDKEDKSAEAVPKITLKLGPASPRPPTPDNTMMKKITIKPLVKKPDDEKKRDPSPELAKISALVTRPPKQKITKFKGDGSSKKGESMDDRESGKGLSAGVDPLVTAVGSGGIAGAAAVDQAGRQVWICPACGNQDDGSPMIGCDDCDAWYHWVCVGVQVPPADHEDWYCRLCIAKKQELHHDKKRKKRKKKVKTLA